MKPLSRPVGINLGRIVCYAVVFSMAFRCAVADQIGSPLDDVLVEVRGLPGMPIDAGKLPGEVWSLEISALSTSGAEGLSDLLTARSAAIHFEDSQSDRFQPTLAFHGFSASPIQGAPQGLAVYQDGVRINEAFGDVVNWDLVPMFAMQNLELVGANPLYGANALGGAVVIGMKDGSTHPGVHADVGVGAFAERHATFEYSTRHGDISWYAGMEGLDERGFRDHSENQIRQAYLSGTWQGDTGRVALSLTLADNALAGPGASPVQELAISPALAFTGPQSAKDRLVFSRLLAEHRLNESSAISAMVYQRHFYQASINGNTTNYSACSARGETGLLCQTDGVTLLHTLAGWAIPDYSDRGLVPIGEIDSASQIADTVGVAAQLSVDFRLAGFAHAVSLGYTAESSRVRFASTAEVAPIGAGLQVARDGSLVATPEGSPFVVTPVELISEERTLAIYLADSIALTAALSLNASARFGHQSVVLEDQMGSALSGRNIYARVNPSIGLGYQVKPRVHAYFDTSETSRAPSASEIECSDPARPCALPSTLAGDPPTLRQVVGHTVEAGIRVGRPGVSMDGVSAQLGLFRTNLTNDIYTVATSAGAGYYRNIGATRRAGLTSDVDYRRASWHLYASIAAVDASFRSPFTIASPQNPFSDANGNIAVMTGDRIPGLPLWRATTGGDADVAPGVRVGATWCYTGPTRLHGDESNQTPPLGGYSRVDFRLAWDWSPSTQISVVVHNLLNRRYATSGLYADPSGIGAPGVPLSPGAVDPRFEVPGSPVAASMNFRVHF